MCGKAMQGTDLSFIDLFERSPGPLADLFCREIIAGPENGDEIIRLLCQTKELLTQPLLHFSRSLVGEGQGHNLRDG